MPSRKGFVLIVLLIVMEILASFAVFAGTSLYEVTPLGYATWWLLLLSGLGGVLTGLAVVLLRPPAPWDRIALLAGAVPFCVVPIAAVSRQPVTFAVGLVLGGTAFWRGLVLTGETPGLREAQRRFGSGFSIYIVGVILIIGRGVIDRPAVWHLLVATGIAYVITAMLALSVGRLEERREPGSGGPIVLAVTVQLGLLLLLSLGALQLFALDLAGAAGHVVQPALDILGTAILWLVGLIAQPVDHLIHLFQPHRHPAVQPQNVAPPSTADPSGRRHRPQPPGSSPLVNAALLALVSLVLGTITYLIWRALPRVTARTRENDAYREERQWLLSPHDLWTGFLTWILGLLRRTRAGAAVALQGARQRSRGPELPIDPIRRAYAQLLQRAASAGVRRAPAATPEEFESALGSRWPAGHTEVRTLTLAYMERRYGDRAPDAARLVEVNEGWSRLCAVLRSPALPALEGVSPAGSAAVLALPPTRRRRFPWQAQADDEFADRHTLAKQVGFLALLALGPIVIVLLVLGVLFTALGWVGAGGGEDPTSTAANGIALDGRGGLYITELRQDRVARLSAAGKVFFSFGGSGSRAGQLRGPQTIALDQQGHLFVADTGNNRIQEFTPQGAWMHSWGTGGSGTQQLRAPWGVTVDTSGTIFVTDTGNNRVVVIKGGHRWSSLGRAGVNPGEFNMPRGIAVDRSGHLFVVDSGNRRIEEFTRSGRLIRSWATRETANTEAEPPGPTDIAVNKRGLVYVSDGSDSSTTYNVQIFDSSGRIRAILGEYGSVPGKIIQPRGLAVDATGNVFVADSGNRRIQRFSPDGTPLSELRFTDSATR